MQWIMLIVLTFTFVFGQAASAQEAKPEKEPPKAVPIKWRHDYNEARKEAEKRKLTLVLVITSMPNYYFDRYNTQTLQNPKIAAFLNDKCVPMLVETNKDQTLADHLKVNLYPTTVFASHDGKILGKLVGFQDADKLLERLQAFEQEINRLNKQSLVPKKKPDSKEVPDKNHSIKWRKDIAEARKEAEKRKLPMFLFYTAPFSYHCNKMRENLETPKVAAMVNERFVSLKLDSTKEENRKLAEDFSLTISPTMVIVDRDGTVRLKHVGYADVETLTAILQRLPKQESLDAKKKSD